MYNIYRDLKIAHILKIIALLEIDVALTRFIEFRSKDWIRFIPLFK
jgi:hypothetical protein